MDDENENPALQDGKPDPQPLTIDSLPPEVLAYIMMAVPPKPRKARQIPFEVQLSHVSARWRQVALETPGLWTDVYIYSNRSTGAGAAYIRRSGTTRPLDVRVDIYAFDKTKRGPLESKTLALIASIRTMLIPVLPRVRSLSLFTYLETSMHRLLNIFTGSAFKLERLNISYAEALSLSDNTLRPPAIFAGGMPRIDFLEIDMADSIVPSSIQSRSLTTLCLNSLTPSRFLTFNQFVEILSIPTRLVNLSIQGTTDLTEWPLDTVTSRFTMPNLQNLRFLDEGLLQIKFLLSVSAPNLESLWLDSSLQHFKQYSESVQIKNKNKFPALRYLTIPMYAFHEIQRISAAFPTITHLHLPHGNFNYNGKKLNEALRGTWATVHTIAVSMPRETQLAKMLDAFLDCNNIQQLHVDNDLLVQLKRKHGIHPVVRRTRNMSDYNEAWWDLSLSATFGEAGSTV